MPDKLTDNEIVKALRSWLEEIRKSRQAYLEKVNEEHYPSMRYEYLLSDTIHAINRLQAENDRKDKIYIDLLKTSSERADIISSLKAENERLKKSILPKEGFFNLLCGALVYTKTLEEYNKFRKDFKTEAYKECIEKVKERLAVHSFTSNSTEYTDGMLDCMEWVDSKIEELEKELVGE